MKQEFQLRDSDFHIRESFSKETISFRKKLWEVENLHKKVNMQS